MSFRPALIRQELTAVGISGITIDVLDSVGNFYLSNRAINDGSVDGTSDS
jgi:hypothetical protein